jgi:hypothetical protein
MVSYINTYKRNIREIKEAEKIVKTLIVKLKKIFI